MVIPTDPVDRQPRVVAPWRRRNGPNRRGKGFEYREMPARVSGKSLSSGAAEMANGYRYSRGENRGKSSFVCYREESVKVRITIREPERRGCADADGGIKCLRGGARRSNQGEPIQ